MICQHNTSKYFDVLFFLPLDYPLQKRKSLVKSLAIIGGALHSLLGFLFAVSSTKRKNITRPHHQNAYFSKLPAIIPYLLLNWGLSFLPLDKMSYIYVSLCFSQTYPCCISNSNGVIIVSDRVIKHARVNHTLE